MNVSGIKPINVNFGNISKELHVMRFIKPKEA